MLNLTDNQKRAVFKALVSKSQFNVGVEFKLDKFYNSNIQIVNAVNKIYREVKENPEKYAVSSEVLAMVEKAMEDRRGRYAKDRAILVNTSLVQEKDLVLGAKKKAWILLNEKLDALMKNKKYFRNESLMSVAKMAGIVFDKAQIVKGEATEHIALRAKIDDKISVSEALEQLMRFREAVSSDESG